MVRMKCHSAWRPPCQIAVRLEAESLVILGCCWNLCKEPLYLPRVKWNCVQVSRQTAKPSKDITGNLFHSKIWKTLIHLTHEWLIGACPLVYHKALAPATLDLCSSYPLPAHECPQRPSSPRALLSIRGRPEVTKDYCLSGPALNQWMAGLGDQYFTVCLIWIRYFWRAISTLAPRIFQWEYVSVAQSTKFLDNIPSVCLASLPCLMSLSLSGAN